MKYIKLFKDTLEVIETLSDEQSGLIFKAIIDYSNDKDVKLDGLLSAVFFQFMQQIDRAKTDYTAVCERNKANGLKPKRLGATRSDLKPSEAKTRQDKDKDKEEYTLLRKEIILYLNQVSGKNFRAVNNSHLIARTREGYKLNDFKKVIDVKSSQWLNTEQEIYLRPDTLFGTKFDSYLNEKMKLLKPKELTDEDIWAVQGTNQ